jgi:hypothetical protein
VSEFDFFIETLQKRYHNRALKELKQDRFLYVFHQYLNSCYRENIITTGRQKGLSLDAVSLFSCYQNSGDEYRNLSDKVHLDLDKHSAFDLRQCFSDLQSMKNNTLMIHSKGLHKLLPTILMAFSKR